MQVTGGDGDPECISELSSSAARKQSVHKAGPSRISAHPPEDNGAADDWLCQRRLDALKAIDEGSFSYVAGLSRPSPLLTVGPCYAAVFGLKYAWSRVLAF